MKIIIIVYLFQIKRNKKIPEKNPYMNFLKSQVIIKIAQNQIKVKIELLNQRKIQRINIIKITTLIFTKIIVVEIILLIYSKMKKIIIFIVIII